MSRKSLSLMMISLVVIVILLAAWSMQSTDTRAGSEIPNSPEAASVKAVLEHAYDLIGTAAQTYDVSGFATVFVDTTDYQLTPKQQEGVAAVLGSEAAQKAGYLTAMQAHYLSLGRGAKLLQAALTQAKAEGRELSAEEFQAIIKVNHDQIPTLPSPVVAKTNLTYESIEFAGSRATVRYDDGAALQEAILVNINDQWYIAGITPVWVHF
jgi:GNAT superfamily N-acetyltransferase